MKLLGKIKCFFGEKEPEPWDGYKLPPKDISEPVLTIAALMETQPERWKFRCDGKSYPEIVDTITGEAFPYEYECQSLWGVYTCYCLCDWMTRDEQVVVGGRIYTLIKKAEDLRQLALLEKAKEERERLKGLYL